LKSNSNLPTAKYRPNFAMPNTDLTNRTKARFSRSLRA
jgi:hypothetical protein